MRRWKMNSCVIKFLAGLVLLYMFIVSLELPFVFQTGFAAVSQELSNELSNDTVSRQIALGSEEELEEKEAPVRPLKDPHRASNQQPSQSKPQRRMIENKTLSSLSFDGGFVNPTGKDGFSGIQKLAKEAFELGKKLWKELESGKARDEVKATVRKQTGSCPNSISLSGYKLVDKGQIVMLPCGLKLGSQITLVGKPRHAHAEYYPKIPLLKEGQYVMVSQFMMEIQGLKTVHGEDPPKILHFNPRLKGDWSGKPVIEQNTCYRMQWGAALRCEGSESRADEETVDAQVKCEKWIIARDDHSEESKATWWANRVIGRTNKVTIDWPFPFTEGKLFVLTLRAGLEGYHVNVNGRHVTSFPYHTGFTLEDAAGISLKGDIDVHSIFATSLPTSHPNFDPQGLLEISSRWQSPPLPDEPVGLFIGVLSAGNHFAERMALRKSWMQHSLIKSSNVVARFFVALHARKEVNAVLKKEAELFGDIVIVPYMDNYDLVVLKTVAIAEFGIQTVPAKYIMKCDDDTFVRVDAVIEEVKKVPGNKSFYIGNINYYHKPLRHGKWAVTYQEWPEATYPPYANGPGYVVSSDIAHFIVSEFKNHKLRLFKMEDVSMGMWVGQFNSSRPVDYIHSWKFCQFGCVENYYTAHYQSPKQIMCLWNKLQEQGPALCCNMR